MAAFDDLGASLAQCRRIGPMKSEADHDGGDETSARNGAAITSGRGKDRRGNSSEHVHGGAAL
jgi:hypothetical protein